MSTTTNPTFKMPPSPVIFLAALGGMIALAGVGAYVYALWQTALMAGGTRYAVVLPEQKPVDVKTMAQCDPSVQSRWLGCALPPVTPAATGEAAK